MDKKSLATKEARNLMLNEYQGVLSTLSVDVPGFPFGSVVPYCLDRVGRPVILISRIAQHTKNIQADEKVSLIVAESGADDIQANGRVTYLGNAKKVAADDQDTIDRYYNYFPDAVSYHKAHDFDLFYIELHRLRFIGGFGQIYWINTQSYLKTNPLSAEQEQGAVEHMNEDHLKAIRHYCSLANISLNDDDSPELSGVDGEGFHIRVGQRIHRFHFDEPIQTPLELRQKLIDLAHKAA